LSRRRISAKKYETHARTSPGHEKVEQRSSAAAAGFADWNQLETGPVLVRGRWSAGLLKKPFCLARRKQHTRGRQKTSKDSALSWCCGIMSNG
jgi:hypothetical protein